jgi:O-antigen/teichoic acid export membrane protein
MRDASPEPATNLQTANAESSVLSDPDIAERVVRGGALRAIGFGVVNLLGILSSIVLLRHLGVSDFGRYGTVIALVAIASGLADAGLNMTGSRELSLLPRGPERRHLLGALLGARLLLLTAATLAAVAFAAVAGYDSTMVVGTALAGTGAALVGAQSTLTLPLSVELKNGLVTLSEIWKQVILLVGVVALAAAGAALTPFFAVQVAVGVGALIAVPFLVARSDLSLPTFSREGLKRLAIVALPVAVASIVTAFYVRILIVLASLLTSEYETGLFVTSARILEMLGGIALLVVSVILPVATVAARDDRGRLQYVLAHTTKVALLGGALLALIVVVAAEPIVVLLGGEQFAPASSVLQIQGPVVLTIFVIYSWTAFLIADGHRRALVSCMLIGLAVLFITGIPLISQLDAEGAALAALAADLVLAAVMLRTVRRVGGGRVGVEPNYLARYLAAVAAAAGVALVGLAIVPDAVAATAAAVTFIASAFVLRLLPSELIALVPGRGSRAQPADETDGGGASRLNGS